MRTDLIWPSGVDLREQVWGWRHDINAQIVNPDIDGLLTACLLHHLKGWPVIGFYDTQRLLVDTEHALPLDLARTAWVDVDMCWPGTRSLSQHVVLDRPGDLEHVSAYASTVNPSLLRGHARQRNYRNKYPFGTFQWTWWLAGIGGLPDPNDALMTGLAWMPDGGFRSVRDQWRTNCVQWAVDQLPNSILSPLAATDPNNAWNAVRVAEAELRRLSGVSDGWRNHQFNLTQGSATGPVLGFPVDEVPGVLQSICDAICTIYGWDSPRIPTHLDVHEGRWRTGDGASGWVAWLDRAP